jgi:hypothetical protein
MYHFAKDNKYPWPLLHCNVDYNLLDSYGVKTYPYFIFIDKKGNYISNPALAPSQNIESKISEAILQSGNK